MIIEHSHCPYDCEHPQPFELAHDPALGELSGKWLCGRCWATAKIATVMVPCTPETCEDEWPAPNL